MPPVRTIHHMKVSRQRGFTLVEMLVAIGVFVILTSVLLFNYNNFNKRLSLDILAHQLAQWVRDAQVSAMSVRQARTSVIAKYPGYGLHFDVATPLQFQYFADLDGDKQYDPLTGGQKCGDPGSIECEKAINVLQGNRIEMICGSASSPIPHPQGSCPSGMETLQSLNIVFLRPNPDASIIGEHLLNSTTTYARADIMITTPKGYRRTVEVWTTGQISVQ